MYYGVLEARGADAGTHTHTHTHCTYPLCSANNLNGGNNQSCVPVLRCQSFLAFEFSSLHVPASPFPINSVIGSRCLDFWEYLNHMSLLSGRFSILLCASFYSSHFLPHSLFLYRSYTAHLPRLRSSYLPQAPIPSSLVMMDTVYKPRTG